MQRLNPKEKSAVSITIKLTSEMVKHLDSYDRNRSEVIRDLILIDMTGSD